MLYDVRNRTPSMEGHKCNPHTWRHSFASYLAQQNVNPEVMRRVFGWASNEMAMTYVHINDQAVKSALLKLSGRKVIIPEPKLVPKVCWRCGYNEIAPDRLICPKCCADLDNPIAKHDAKEQEKGGHGKAHNKLENALLNLSQLLEEKQRKEIGI